jgi:hypothetical protein
MPLLVVFRVFCNKSVFAILAFPGLQAYSVRRGGLRRFVKARPQLVFFVFVLFILYIQVKPSAFWSLQARKRA